VASAKFLLVSFTTGGDFFTARSRKPPISATSAITQVRHTGTTLLLEDSRYLGVVRSYFRWVVV
jgi:hypothetical protein